MIAAVLRTLGDGWATVRVLTLPNWADLATVAAVLTAWFQLRRWRREKWDAKRAIRSPGVWEALCTRRAGRGLAIRDEPLRPR